MEIQWDGRFSERAGRMKSSIIRELLKLTEQPDVISFGGGLPSPEVFPVERFADACDVVLKELGPQSLQYGATEGYRPLRDFLAVQTTSSGAAVSEENVQITSGSQQGLDFLGRVLIDPGDRILVESPTYLGALQAWAVYGAEYVTVPCDENGMIVEQIEARLREKPKCIYMIPNFQNPTGVTLSLERRRKLVELADRYAIPIVEDDPYGKLRFEGDDLPSLLDLDAQMRGNKGGTYRGNVIHLGTFSKILAPGLRLAWTIAHPDVIARIVQAKQGADLHTATFTQMVAFEVAHNGFLDRQVEIIRKVYRDHRDIMLDAMEREFPAGIHWTRPQGGLFLWVTLPQGCNSEEILLTAVEKEKVAFVPGAPFHPLGGGENTLRMNYSNASPDAIQRGVRRLGRVFSEEVRKN
jgi:2-aminoadipate transaminase